MIDKQYKITVKPTLLLLKYLGKYYDLRLLGDKYNVLDKQPECGSANVIVKVIVSGTKD